MRGLLLAGLLLLSPLPSLAADACAGFGTRLGSLQYPERIAGIACQESYLWHRPFIDGAGRLAGGRAMEGESTLLADSVTPAWQRVVAYWRDTGLLPAMAAAPGASDCVGATGSHWRNASCRAFLIDKPWSAAFVSYVVGTRAGVPGFRVSAAHSTYVREAFRNPGGSPFTAVDPLLTPASTGDLLCFTRTKDRVFGPEGLRQRFSGRDGDGGLDMHCDIVVGNAGGRLTLVGGNVMHGVTLRSLPIGQDGRPSSWPQRTAADPPCAPDNEAACNLNRQDWAVLLKLKPLPQAAYPMAVMPTGVVPPPACCVYCVAGAPYPPRCPKEVEGD